MSRLKVKDIATTTDEYLSNDNFSKPGVRHVVVTKVTDKSMTIHKCKKIKGKEVKVIQGTLIPLDDNYSTFTLKTGVDTMPILTNKYGKPLKPDDPNIKSTNESLTNGDFNKVLRTIHNIKSKIKK